MNKLLSLIALSLAILPAHAGRDVSETRTIRRSIELDEASRPARLIVDNIFGSIRVTGQRGSTIELVATETFQARDREALERARRETRLDIDVRGNTVDMLVDGPFRDERYRHRGYDWDDYVAVYEFEIRVPYETRLDLKTINQGDIRVADVRGDFRVRNVNGDIEMRDVNGSGDVTTVNGPVRVWFAGNPRDETNFKTINGDVEIHFQPGLDADLAMKTFNGEFWSAFEVEPLPSVPDVRDRDRGKRIIKSRSWTEVRAGGGGPRMTFETLNGDVLIRRNDG